MDWWWLVTHWHINAVGPPPIPHCIIVNQCLPVFIWQWTGMSKLFLYLFNEHFLKCDPEILWHSTVDCKVEWEKQTDKSIDNEANIARDTVVHERHRETKNRKHCLRYRCGVILIRIPCGQNMKDRYDHERNLCGKINKDDYDQHHRDSPWVSTLMVCRGQWISVKMKNFNLSSRA